MSEVIHARNRAFMEACAECKKGNRTATWLHTDASLHIGMSQGRVRLKFFGVPRCFVDCWETMCRRVAKPDTYEVEHADEKHGDYDLAFVPA